MVLKIQNEGSNMAVERLKKLQTNLKNSKL